MENVATVRDILKRYVAELKSVVPDPAFQQRITGIIVWNERQISALQYQQEISHVSNTKPGEVLPQPLKSLLGKPLLKHSEVNRLHDRPAYFAKPHLDGIPQDGGTFSNIQLFKYTPSADDIEGMAHFALLELAEWAGFESFQSGEDELRKYLLDKLAAGALEPDTIDQRREINELYSKILVMDAGDVVDKYHDSIIRGLAKKAGMNVTDSKPKNVYNTAFIADIKKAIEEKNKLMML